jgi:hypothetical protein
MQHAAMGVGQPLRHNNDNSRGGTISHNHERCETTRVAVGALKYCGVVVPGPLNEPERKTVPLLTMVPSTPLPIEACRPQTDFGLKPSGWESSGVNSIWFRAILPRHSSGGVFVPPAAAAAAAGDDSSSSGGATAAEVEEQQRPSCRLVTHGIVPAGQYNCDVFPPYRGGAARMPATRMCGVGHSSSTISAPHTAPACSSRDAQRIACDRAYYSAYLL